MKNKDKAVTESVTVVVLVNSTATVLGCKDVVMGQQK